MDEKLFQKLKQQLTWLWDQEHPSFWRDRFKSMGFDPRRDFNSIDDLRKVVPISKEDLAPLDPFEWCYNKKRIDIVRTTSGTTGQPLVVFRSVAGTASKRANPFANVMRPLLLGSFHSAHLYYLSGLKSGRKMKKPILPLIGKIDDLETTAKIATQFEVDGIFGVVDVIAGIAPLLSPETRLKIKIISLISAYPRKHLVKYLQEQFPEAGINTIYAMAETGPIGYQCRNLEKSGDMTLFHSRRRRLYVEVLSNEKGDAGEILITTLMKTPHPLVRYRTMDAAQWVGHRCSPESKREKPVLKLLGRINYDLIKIMGATVHSLELERVILSLPFLFKPDFEAEVVEERLLDMIKPRLRISLSPASYGPCPPAEVVAREIERRLFVTPKRTLDKLVAEGTFSATEVKFVSSFENASQSSGKKYQILRLRELPTKTKS